MFSIVETDQGFELLLDGKPISLRAQSKESLFDLASSIVQFLQNPEEPVQYGLRSGRWASVRNEFVKNNPYCAACGATECLNVHHIAPFHENPELELEESNLITVCYTCHFLFGHLKSWKSHNPNVLNDTKWFKEKMQNRPKN